MDTSNVNASEQSGLKRLLKHAVPLGSWVDCDNHKMVLCSKHPSRNFLDVFSADAILIALWKLFH